MIVVQVVNFDCTAEGRHANQTETKMYHHTQPSMKPLAQNQVAALGEVFQPGGAVSDLDGLFDQCGTVKRFQPGEIVFMEGDAADVVYRVASGMVLACVITQDGRRQIARFVSDGGTMGLTALGSHSYTAEAVDCVDVQICPRNIYETAVMENAALRSEMIRTISAELTASRDQMVLLGRMTATEKAATFLLRMAAQLKCTKSGFVRMSMTRADIGDYLGLTLETVSRLLNGLHRERIIDMPAPDRFRILDAEALGSLATPI